MRHFLKMLTAGLILIAMLSGCRSGQPQSKDRNDQKVQSHVYTLKDVLYAFSRNAITLTPMKQDTAKYALNGVRPKVYAILNNKKDLLYIYVFKSNGITRRLSASGSFQNMSHNLKPSLQNTMIEKYKAWNIYMFQTFSIPNPANLQPVVFNDLNQGRTVVYSGTSKHWQGQVTLKYYEHDYNDDRGLEIEGQDSSYGSVKYRGSEINNIGPISYDYQISAGESSGKGRHLDRHGYFSTGEGGGNGMISVDNEITMTIQWNGNKEAIRMTRLPEGQSALIPGKLLPQQQGKTNLIYAAPKGQGNEAFETPAFLQKAFGSESGQVLKTAQVIGLKGAQASYPYFNIKKTPCFIFLDMRGIALKTNDVKKAAAFLNERSKQ